MHSGDTNGTQAAGMKVKVLLSAGNVAVCGLYGAECREATVTRHRQT